MNILNDKQKISVFPYVFDQVVSGEQRPHILRRLVEVDRVDLLNQMTIPKLDGRHFYDLLSVPLPQFIDAQSARVFQRKLPTLELSSLVAWAIFGNQTNTFLEAFCVSLFVLRHSHEKEM